MNTYKLLAARAIMALLYGLCACTAYAGESEYEQEPAPFYRRTMCVVRVITSRRKPPLSPLSPFKPFVPATP